MNMTGSSSERYGKIHLLHCSVVCENGEKGLFTDCGVIEAICETP